MHLSLTLKDCGIVKYPIDELNHQFNCKDYIETLKIEKK